MHILLLLNVCKQTFHISHVHVHISKSKTCLNAKSSAYYFHMKTNILWDFRICIKSTFKNYCFCVCVKRKAFWNCLCSFSSCDFSALSGISVNSEQKVISQTIEQLIQFSYLFLLKRNFSGLFFFRTRRSEGEFPESYLIKTTPCLFASH